MNELDWYPPDVDESSYIFKCTSDELPDNSLLLPSVGNGHIATVVYRDRLFMNGLYNGVGKQCHKAAIPALNRIRVKELPQAKSEYSLDCIKGTFSHVQTNDVVVVSHKACAHRTIPSLLINQISVHRITSSSVESQVNIDLEIGTDFISPDIKLKDIGSDESRRDLVGSILETEVPSYSKQIKTFYICMDRPPTTLVLPASTQSVTCTYLMSINSCQQHAIYQYNKGTDLAAKDLLMNEHYLGWCEIWQQGRIDIWSDNDVPNITCQLVYGCQYYLLSSLPSQYQSDCVVDEFYGLSPESLAYGDGSHDDYLGHVFWDQETWMYPPILLLHPDIAHKLITSRLRVVEQAKMNAAVNGLKGTQFPWEQAVTGAPVSPSDDCEKYEIHITADIALALRQYLYATGSLPDSVAELSEEIREYWTSRLTWNDEKGMYDILDVMPPDEWHYPVNNSAYTNVAAKMAISLPRCLGSTQSHERGDLAERGDDPKIYVPFDEELNYHPEFDGYRVKDPKSSQVKQADVVLIGYPLNSEPNRSVRARDLELYEGVTTSDGPAMTWSMFCIGHMELDQPIKAKAMFEKQMVQATQPFQVWSEYPGGKGAINFITGMGGFLQSVLNGYVGVRLEANSLAFKPAIPPTSSRLKITGLSYHGGKFNIDITEGQWQVVRGDNLPKKFFYTNTNRQKSDRKVALDVDCLVVNDLCSASISRC